MMKRKTILSGAGLSALMASLVVQALPLPGGTLDPLTIPKYVTPLVIPPVMKNSGEDNDYDIAVRQFKQQILPGGIWASLPGCALANCTFPATPIWSYGPAAEDREFVADLVAPSPTSQFNYPAHTIENTANTLTTVDWINDLVDPVSGEFRPHLLPVDRTLHWANPEGLTCIDADKNKDCRPAGSNGAILQEPYDGPVPIVTHVHGAHVGPESDGYPEAWWLPDASNIPLDYATEGSLANGYGGTSNTANGVGSFSYPNDQPSTTLWYHDHTLGMTRSNVYAGPAGFWLIRDPAAPLGSENGLVSGVLPAPAPVAGQQVLDLNVPGNPVRNSIREIPIAIQGRSFNNDGSLFYPGDRAFFEGVATTALQIPFIGDGASDISPIWNPEAFFNVMVVNGVSWPELEVAPAIYRFRMLNGSNSRFLNLSLQQVTGNTKKDNGELPFYQIGAEQSLLPQVVRIETGFATPLPGTGADIQANFPTCTLKNGQPKSNCVVAQPAVATEQALLIGLAERADVLVDFRGRENGDIIRMINTGPDAPFGGFGGNIPADPATTGQVMQFRVNSALLGASPTDPVDALGNLNPSAASDPSLVALTLPDSNDPAADGNLRLNPQNLALLEEESAEICVNFSMNGTITHDPDATPDGAGNCIDSNNNIVGSLPFAPKAAVLGTNGSGGGTAQLWADPITTNPALDTTETWELWNWTADAHPIHLHLVKFKVVNREAFDVDGTLSGTTNAPLPSEAGWKDTVITYPGEVTRLNATFDKEGLYVWHCHIVEHEDNEMMVPFCVGDPEANGCSGLVAQ